VDFGVHMLHRYRVDDTTRPLGLSAGTGKGIALTALTTIIGFGAMLVARHRGIASLGFVLALGVALTLLACLTLMPALLELRSRRRAAKASTR
jgi:predicted RND superfamily exporter protein